MPPALPASLAEQRPPGPELEARYEQLPVAQEDVLEMADWLGIDADAHPDLMCLAGRKRSGGSGGLTNLNPLGLFLRTPLPFLMAYSERLPTFCAVICCHS